nr:MAG TPA: Shoulder domain [Caudoviricetes sp.]
MTEAGHRKPHYTTGCRSQIRGAASQKNLEDFYYG